MAIFSVQNNRLYRIEVKFQPGIPKIEILGSSAKSIKDSAIKAKLLLQQMGLRFPKNKKTYVCIDPFVSSHEGIELAIFMAMKHAIENVSMDAFVSGNVSFDGKTCPSLKDNDFLIHVPISAKYLIARNDLNVMNSIHWKEKLDNTNLVWIHKLGPTLVSALYRKETILFLISKEDNIDSFLQSLKEVYYRLHQEVLEIHTMIQSKTVRDIKNQNTIATASICPCSNKDFWKKQICKMSRKKCHSHLKNLKIKDRPFLILPIDSDSFVTSKVNTKMFKNHVSVLPMTLKGGEKKWVEEVLEWIPMNEQKDAVELLLTSLRHYRLLCSNEL
ncbi:MAG: hypothetical protein KDD37_11085 [Bdellovibrionales bacterium]|nr:hypothetical protein [Bdellovibrionales bacterium]